LRGSTYGSIVEVQVWSGERDTTQKGMRISCTRQTGEWRKYERDLEDGNGNGKGDEVLGPGQEGFMTTGVCPMPAADLSTAAGGAKVAIQIHPPSSIGGIPA